jgi:hypothetical protein
LERGEGVRRGDVGYEGINGGVGEDELDFGGFEEVVDGDGDGTGLEDAEESGDEFGAVLEPDSDAISRLDGEIAIETPSHPEGAGAEFGVGELGVAPEEGGFLGMPAGGVKEVLGEVHGSWNGGVME